MIAAVDRCPQAAIVLVVRMDREAADNLKSGPPPVPATHAPMAAKRKRLRQLAALLIAGLTGAALLFFFDPVNAGFFPKCYFHQATGLYCTGCGTTRALHALSHGRLDIAARHNLFLLFALPALAWSFVRFAREAFTGRQCPRRPLAPFLRWMLVFLVLAFTVLRNLPYEPFVWLAPPKPVAGKAVLDAQ
jgi:hypothetical protein